MLLNRSLFLLCTALAVNALAASSTPTATVYHIEPRCEGDDGGNNNGSGNSGSGSCSSSSGHHGSGSSGSGSSSGEQHSSGSSPTGTSSPSGGSNSTGSSPGQTYSGGVATFYTQGGQAGACGQVHSDNDLICAMDQDRYGDSSNASPLCGKQVHITNTKNGKTVTVTVADDCPTCDNANSIDLSVGAFTSIATKEEGEVPIEWYFV